MFKILINAEFKAKALDSIHSTLSDLIYLMQRHEILMNGQSALADLSFEPTVLTVGGRGIFFPSRELCKRDHL